MSTAGTPSSTRGRPGGGRAAAPSPAGSAPVGAGRRRGQGTVVDMLRSLLVCGVIVGIVVVLFFRTSSATPAPADTAAATTAARAAGLPVRVPHLPARWRASSARYAPDTTEGLPTWHVGYIAPSGSDAEVDVTRGATPAWIDGVLGGDSAPGDGESARTRVVDGVRWTLRSASVDGGTVRALVRTDGEVTTVVSGHARPSALEVLAAAAD